MKKPSIFGLAPIAAVLLVVAINFDPAAMVSSRQKKNDALVDIYKQMHKETHRTSRDQLGYAPLNRFYRFPNLVEPSTAGNFNRVSHRRGLERALTDGREIVEAGKQRTIPDFNGWLISRDIGRYGYQYMHRASVVAGGYGNLPGESLYPAMVFDGNGHLLSGDNTDRLHFDKGPTPPVNGFWSLSVYNLDSQLEETRFAAIASATGRKGYGMRMVH